MEISVQNDGSGQVWTIVGGPYFPGNSSTWIPQSVNLSSYSGQKVRIGFTHIGNAYNSWGWYIDDIEISPVPLNFSILDPIGDRKVDPGDLLWFLVTASDPDGDELTLTASNLPDGATFIDNGDGTGEFCCKTTADDEGVYSSILFRVTDSSGLSDSEEITITVAILMILVWSELVINYSNLASCSRFFILSASDPDEDELTFTATNLPPGAIFTDNGDNDDTAQFELDTGRGSCWKLRCDLHRDGQWQPGVERFRRGDTDCG